jgi:hypothetical protein
LKRVREATPIYEDTEATRASTSVEREAEAQHASLSTHNNNVAATTKTASVYSREATPTQAKPTSEGEGEGKSMLFSEQTVGKMDDIEDGADRPTEPFVPIDETLIDGWGGVMEGSYFPTGDGPEEGVDAAGNELEDGLVEEEQLNDEAEEYNQTWSLKVHRTEHSTSPYQVNANDPLALLRRPSRPNPQDEEDDLMSRYINANPTENPNDDDEGHDDDGSVDPENQQEDVNEQSQVYEGYHSGDTDDFEMDHRPVLERTAVKRDIKNFVASLSFLQDHELYKVVDRLGEGELFCHQPGSG